MGRDEVENRVNRSERGGSEVEVTGVDTVVHLCGPKSTMVSNIYSGRISQI